MSYIALRQNQTFDKPYLVNNDEQDDIVQAKLDRIVPGINLRDILDEAGNDRFIVRQAFSDAVDRIDDLRDFILQRLTKQSKPDFQAETNLSPQQEREIRVLPDPILEKQTERGNEPTRQPEPIREQPQEPVPEPIVEQPQEPVPEPIAEQPAEPVPEPVLKSGPEPTLEEPPSKNMSNQKPQGSRLYSSNLPSQQFQKSAQSQVSQKTGNDSFMAASESLPKSKGSQTSSLTQPFPQVKTSRADLSFMEAQAAQKTGHNPSTATAQNLSSAEKTLNGNNAKGFTQDMGSLPQGQMDAQKAQGLKNNQQMQMAQKNGHGLQMLSAAGYNGSRSGHSSSLMESSPANGRLSLSGSSDKTSLLQLNNDKNAKAAALKPLTEELAQEKTASTNALPSHLSEAAAKGLQQIHPQELLAMSKATAMPPVEYHTAPSLSTLSLSQPTSLSSQPSPSRIQPLAQQTSASKEIKVIAAAPAPVLLSNSSAMNTVTSEKNEEDEEEKEENTPLIRAVVFGGEELIDVELQELIEALKDNKVKLVLLSQREKHPLFDLCLQSSKIYAKPDWTAYREKIAIPADEILFIDRDPARVQGAKIMGLNALVFASSKQLKQELVKKKLITT